MHAINWANHDVVDGARGAGLCAPPPACVAAHAARRAAQTTLQNRRLRAREYCLCLLGHVDVLPAQGALVPTQSHVAPARVTTYVKKNA